MTDTGGYSDDARVASETLEPPDTTTADLTTTVMRAAEDDPGLTDDARLLLLSALPGDDDLQLNRSIFTNENASVLSSN